MTTPRDVAAQWLARLDAERLVPLPAWFHFAKLAEETGEATQAYLRYAGMARSPGGPAQLGEELADVVITAYCCALSLGLDLDAAAGDKLRDLLARDLGALGHG
jgi:NTP pyrophosphatase (non-canonical NTP hydrolase)